MHSYLALPEIGHYFENNNETLKNNTKCELIILKNFINEEFDALKSIL